MSPLSHSYHHLLTVETLTPLLKFGPLKTAELHSIQLSHLSLEPETDTCAQVLLQRTLGGGLCF